MDKIYIPTLGRVNKQITYNNLPDFLKKKTVLVIQPKEKNLHGDKQTLILPDNDIGICKTRKFLYEYANSKKERYGVFDDDLTFLKRQPKGNKPVKVEMSSEDWRECINVTNNWFDNNISFSALRVGVIPPRYKDYIDNSAAYTAYFFNGENLPSPNKLDWSIELGEDTHLVLQLLRLGYSNRVWDKFIFHQKEHSEGGCNTYRTSKMINDGCKQLIDAHPNYVYYDKNKFRVKKFDNDMTFKIRIKWKNAYLDSQKGSLNEFIT